MMVGRFLKVHGHLHSLEQAQLQVLLAAPVHLPSVHGLVTILDQNNDAGVSH